MIKRDFKVINWVINWVISFITCFSTTFRGRKNMPFCKVVKSMDFITWSFCLSEIHILAQFITCAWTNPLVKALAFPPVFHSVYHLFFRHRNVSGKTGDKIDHLVYHLEIAFYHLVCGLSPRSVLSPRGGGGGRAGDDCQLSMG